MQETQKYEPYVNCSSVIDNDSKNKRKLGKREFGQKFLISDASSTSSYLKMGQAASK